MKYLRLFESDDISVWEEDLLSLYDIFCELEDAKICRLDYQGGYMTGMGNRSYPCFLKDGEIHGDKNHVKFMINTSSKSLLRVSLLQIKYKEYSPFSQTNAPSFYNNDANIFLQIMKYINVAKERIPDYTIGITLDEKVIYLDFLRNK